MPAIYVGEIWNGRTGSADEHGARSYARVFRVITDSQWDGQTVAMGAIGIPKRFSPYVDANLNVDVGCIARKVDAKQDQDHPCYWLVTIAYSTSELRPRKPPSKTDPSKQGSQDPLQRPPTYKLSFNTVQRPLEEDLDGQAVVNSAGEKFDPPPMIEDCRPVLTITRNESSLDIFFVIDYHNSINSDAFFPSITPGQCKLKIEADEQNENEEQYWKMTYTLEFRHEGWLRDGKFLDQGFHIIDITTGSPNLGLPKVLTDGQGKCLTAPALLQNGQLAPRLNSAGHPDPAGTITPSYMQYTVYRQRPFGLLTLLPPS